METGALLCPSAPPAPPAAPSAGLAVQRLPPKLLVSATDAAMEVTNTPAHHGESHCQRDPGVSQGHQAAGGG